MESELRENGYMKGLSHSSFSGYLANYVQNRHPGIDVCQPQTYGNTQINRNELIEDIRISQNYA